ncbi:MAG: hypothetical protein JXJ19_06300 [Elusimicrobia bacterium]|nr:hypothetical protein [Elusimicrobiota bacterium]
MIHLNKRLPLLMLLLLITGCATTPTTKVWHPWLRTLKNEKEINIGSKLTVDVKGKTDPLLGSEVLLQNKIRYYFKQLLLRRGYEIVNSNADYNVILEYSTSRNDKQYSYSQVYSMNKNEYTYDTLYGINHGLGVSIAMAVNSLTNKSATVATNETINIETYIHSISILFNEVKTNNAIWKGEATWDSNRLDLGKDIEPAIRLLVSGLPLNDKIYPRVKKIKQGKETNYYELECKNKWFFCPALPYNIFFTLPSESNAIPDGVKNPEALVAYIDLIQSAEYALPTGSRNYKNPLLKSLWSKVVLGGKYYMGTDENQIKVLIKLKGTNEGYIVNKCIITTDEEYSKYENQFGKWKNALEDYYNIYEE